MPHHKLNDTRIRANMKEIRTEQRERDRWRESRKGKEVEQVREIEREGI